MRWKDAFAAGGSEGDIEGGKPVFEVIGTALRGQVLRSYIPSAAFAGS